MKQNNVKTRLRDSVIPAQGVCPLAWESKNLVQDSASIKVMRDYTKAVIPAQGGVSKNSPTVSVFMPNSNGYTKHVILVLWTHAGRRGSTDTGIQCEFKSVFNCKIIKRPQQRFSVHLRVSVIPAQGVCPLAWESSTKTKSNSQLKFCIKTPSGLRFIKPYLC